MDQTRGETSAEAPAEAAERYDPGVVEARWRARWAAERLYEVDVDRVTAAEKFYNLVEFPYPSAEGLHVGHAYTYAGADAYGRWQRMRGRVVFQPIGFDAFGIHTENYALRVGVHPKPLTARTIARYTEQLTRLGAAWDWSRQVTTSDPAYYRWTQWVFLRLFRAGLAVRKAAPVVWCPSCLTVLAYEQLEGGGCERCGSEVVRRVLRQWFLRTTAYADALLDGLDGLDWPETAKRMQRDWIGRTPGVLVPFPLRQARGAGGTGPPATLEVFTDRPEALSAATFLLVAPEHPGLASLTAGTGREAAVRAVAERARGPRAATAGTPSAALTGAWATHPLTGAGLPVVVSDRIEATEDDWAVPGVPAVDAADRAIAEALGIPSRPDPAPVGGRTRRADREAAAAWLAERGIGRPAVRYRLRDWLISRQRYWGTPIPVIYCQGCGVVPVPEEDLPVVLPDVAEFRPRAARPGDGASGGDGDEPAGTSPLAAVESFVRTTCPRCGGPGRRETDVSDTFLDSSWYFLRYPSTDVHDAPWDPDRVARLLPVDLYAGGPEHVVRHHLYARFVTRALHDLGLLPFGEPFPRVRLHGIITAGGVKMSKTRGNVVVPDDYVRRVGADNLRLYLLSFAPWEEGGAFSDAGLAGVERFTERLWRMVTTPGTPGPGGVDLRPVDRAVAAVGRDLERFRFNTAIGELLALARWASGRRDAMSEPEWSRTARTLVLLTAPFAPHLAEELWARLGGPFSVHRQPWPEYDPAALQAATFTLVVQVNGRVRDRVEAPVGIGRDDAVALAVATAGARRHLAGRAPRDAVFVPDRLVNLLV
jgi:leucyl-tRNA synthetase